MTNFNSPVPSQHSAFSSAVVNLLTVAMLAAAGFLTLAQFVNV